MAKVSEIYGSMVFNEHTMQERLPSATYKSLRKTIEEGKPLDQRGGERRGARHEGLGHREGRDPLHPLVPAPDRHHRRRSTTASSLPCRDGTRHHGVLGQGADPGRARRLLASPPAACAPPSRPAATPRGTPPATPSSRTRRSASPPRSAPTPARRWTRRRPFCAPWSAIDQQAMRVLRLFGDETPSPGDHHRRPGAGVFPDRQGGLRAARRPDHVPAAPCSAPSRPRARSWRSTTSAPSAPRSTEFMKELDDELWKLGVSAKTKHNEVAPAQHELAPIFTNTNRAIDQNQLTMEMMKTGGRPHTAWCACCTRSPSPASTARGKHNNWSLSTDNGATCSTPARPPWTTPQFLAVPRGRHQGGGRLSGAAAHASVASAGNDHRLGANEAPPAIISIFLGDELGAIVDAHHRRHSAYTSADKADAWTWAWTCCPHFLKDNTDRNRTSPFAFTGNKFEFRMPGSAVNLSDCQHDPQHRGGEEPQGLRRRDGGEGSGGLRGGRHRATSRKP